MALSRRGTCRPVLKSTTRTASPVTSSRSTVPATTVPSGRVAAIGASASASGENKAAMLGRLDDGERRVDQARAQRRIDDPGGALKPGKGGLPAITHRRGGQPLEQGVEQASSLGSSGERRSGRRATVGVRGDLRWSEGPRRPCLRRRRRPCPCRHKRAGCYGRGSFDCLTQHVARGEAKNAIGIGARPRAAVMACGHDAVPAVRRLLPRRL